MRQSGRVVVVGAGVAGLCAAIELRRAGWTDVQVYEKADRLGGTWRENTYPGVACDVPSHLYSYSFAPNPSWSHVFSPGDEILAYLEAVAAEHGVDELVELGVEVRALTYERGGWTVALADGRVDRADVVFAATGVLHHPRYPDIDGLDDFAGACFHSARWDHSVAIDGARVGIVGTGSTAVQITTAIVDRVAELHLFQRTAQWVLPVPNPPMEPIDPATIPDIRRHYATTFEHDFADVVVDATSPQLEVIQALCLANLEDNVTDPDLRERLRPSYRAACKRLIVSPGFYEAITRPNATLVTDPIERVEAKGVRTADGALHELDVLVLATGFRVDRFLRPIQVVGRGGARLDDAWRERPTAYLGLAVPGFPNLFLLNGPNGPVGNFSLIEVAELQVAYVLRLLAHADGGGVEVLAEALERFEAERVEAARDTVWVTGCRSWYLDDRGIPAAWPWTFGRFREAMAAPDLAAYGLGATASTG